MNIFVFLLICFLALFSLSIAVTTVYESGGKNSVFKLFIGLVGSLAIGGCVFYTLTKIVHSL